MSEKYLDLIERVDAESRGYHLRTTIIEGALRWLDENPDQVPGRTITESEISKAFGPEYVAWARMCLARIGITVVPDPEPTSAEKLADDIREVDGGHNLGAGVLAERLASLGWTKAPGGDDEH